MRKLIALSLMLSFLAVGFVSCSKYEEGPALSLRTKMSRITGEWKLDRALTDDGVVVGSYSDNFSYVFNEDGTGTRTDNNTSEGVWEFNDEKTEITFTYQYFNQPLTLEFEIIKLKNKELILYRKSNSVITQGHRMYFDKQ